MSENRVRSSLKNKKKYKPLIHFYKNNIHTHTYIFLYFSFLHRSNKVCVCAYIHTYVWMCARSLKWSSLENKVNWIEMGDWFSAPQISNAFEFINVCILITVFRQSWLYLLFLFKANSRWRDRPSLPVQIQQRVTFSAAHPKILHMFLWDTGNSMSPCYVRVSVDVRKWPSLRVVLSALGTFYRLKSRDSGQRWISA